MDATKTWPQIGVIIVTYKARDLLADCIRPLQASSLKPRILVVNSSSKDGTVECARALGADVLIVPRNKFNHGATRELARQHLGTPITVMLTPDAHATGPEFLERLVYPIAEGRASISYGRQQARRDADTIERFDRAFNYPKQSQLRAKKDWPRYGSYTHFCSDACAAWSSEALDEIGGFRWTLVSEETIAASELINRGHRIAYVADAVVTHSHPTSPLRDFKRQFDIGYTRGTFRHLLLNRERDEKRGCTYVRALLGNLAREQPALVPYAILDAASRYAGYRIGMLARHWPIWLSKHFSGQDFFWHQDADHLRASSPVTMG